MKQEYDFSKAERGKFYRPGTVAHIPIYLDPDVEQVLQSLADDTGQTVGVLVNSWLRSNLSIVQAVQSSPNP